MKNYKSSKKLFFDKKNKKVEKKYFLMKKTKKLIGHGFKP
jgi:hypothetical protein